MHDTDHPVTGLARGVFWAAWRSSMLLTYYREASMPQLLEERRLRHLENYRFPGECKNFSAVFMPAPGEVPVGHTEYSYNSRHPMRELWHAPFGAIWAPDPGLHESAEVIGIAPGHTVYSTFFAPHRLRPEYGEP